MSVIGEAALSVFLEFLLGKLVSSRFNFVANHKQIQEQLTEWQSKLPYIQAVLNDAEEKQIKNQHVKKWLADLQDLAYDVDDILDEFGYEDLRLKLQNTQAQASTSKVRKLIPSFCTTSNFSPSAFMFNNEMISKIKEITARLNLLTTQKNSLGLSIEIMSEGARSKGKTHRPLQPTSLLDEAVEYVGRENEKREILELLKSCNAGGKDKVAVISIVGMGGMGKTTLAQLVYNDVNINDSFPHKAWVCVSDHFDAIAITKTILRSITSDSCDENDLNLLQVKLKKELSGKRLLLVLDDIWDISFNDWTILRSPFEAGTKIIVTTRFRDVSCNVQAMNTFHLDKLSHADCLSIFTQYALGARDFDQHPQMKEVGENIVRKCCGLPLAAKLIGHLLCNKNHDYWEKISKSKIWELQEDHCGIIPALRLSYHYLPPHLKRCFAYCSILPKDYEFEEEEIILLWRAEGLLKQIGESQIKDFENQCFRDLLSRSFFQESSSDKSRFIMHDLVNDLAQSVAGEICSKLEDDKQQKFSKRIRHSSWVQSDTHDTKKKFQAFNKVSSLRTFLPFELRMGYSHYFLTSFVLDDLLPRMKYLRVLSLKQFKITKLPHFFGNLKHLHYVDFSETCIKFLPDSICNLYYLETLILRNCKRLEKLPSQIGNLRELHYVDISGANSIKRMPFGIGKLTNIQRLSNFIVGKGDGHILRELKNLSDLSGDFCISGLENVKGQDAWEARLNEKSGIDRLTLEWSVDFDTRIKEKEEQVLDFLHPQKKLEQLTVLNYGGAKLSAWIVDSSFKNLLSLNLYHCKNCKSLPSIGRLPLLKDLVVRGFGEVNVVGVEFFGENQPNAFASLETLDISYMPNWKEWDPCEGDEQVLKFPCLRELRISNCPQLSGRLPARLHSLQKLQIFYCDRLVVSISSFPSLCQLIIYRCEELVDTCSAQATTLKWVSLSNISNFSIPSERIMSMFTNLKAFHIGGWKELASLSQYGFILLGRHFMRIPNCVQWVSLETEEVDDEQLRFGKISSSKLLIIENCEMLNTAPNILTALQFITEVEITKCPSLVCFAENQLPLTLKRLKIEDCQNLKYLVDESQKRGSSTRCFLEDLTIKGCPSLICILSRGDLVNGLRLLDIDDCSNLTSLFSNAKLAPMLEKLSVRRCPELEWIAQDFHETTGLQHIWIEECHKIKSLPQGLDKLSHLEEIYIRHCSNLVRIEESGFPPLTNLRIFEITKCENFRAFPKCINNFTSLRILIIVLCSIHISFPEEGFSTNLTTLYVSNAPKFCMSLFEWGLDRLISLQELVIGGQGCSGVVSFPERDMMLPASLIRITIGKFKNLKYIFSEGFQNLTSLQHLHIQNCPKLAALPEKDKLLSLKNLEILHCPLLKKGCNRGKGREWSKIAHIPEVRIDRKVIIPEGYYW